MNPWLSEMEYKCHTKPCCFGTLTYALGENDRIRDLWQRRFTDEYEGDGNYILIPPGRPGYVGRKPMEKLLSEFEQSELLPDSPLAFYYADPTAREPDFMLRHAALHLDKEVIFHQLSYGQRFCISTIEDFGRLLSEQAQETMSIRAYRPKQAV
jgi:hypothetical protein